MPTQVVLVPGQIRHALRRMIRSPMVALTAVLSLALAIGANTAVFTLVNATLLTPFVVRASDEVVAFDFMTPSGRGRAGRFTFSEVQTWQQQTSALRVVAPHVSLSVRMDSPAGVVRATAAYVGAAYFEVLDTRPAKGRGFEAAEDRPGTTLTAIVTDRLCRSRFESASKALGQHLRINGETYTIVGVMPPNVVGISLAMPADVFLPLGALAAWEGPAFRMMVFGGPKPGMGLARIFECIGRLAPGASPERAAAEAKSVMSAWPGAASTTVHPVPLSSAAVGALSRDSARRFSGMLIAAVGLVLLLGCANLAGLFLARAEKQERDYHVRLALGASRGHVMGLALLDGLLLAVLGGLLAIPLAHWALRALGRFELPGNIRIESLNIDPDWKVFLFAAFVSLAAGIASALAPAWAASHADAVRSLSVGRVPRRWRLQGALVVLQVAVAVALSAFAGLFVQTVQASFRMPLGFDPDGLSMAVLDVRRDRYDEARLKALLDRVTEELAATPAVVAATVGSTSFGGLGLSVDRLSVDGEERRLDVLVEYAAPHYVETIGVPLLEGRDISPADGPNGMPVVLVNASLARLLWRDSDAVGRHLVVPPEKTPRLVVGVVADSRTIDLHEREWPMVYVPRWQARTTMAPPIVVVMRSNLAGVAAAATMREAIARVDRDVAVMEARTYHDRMAQLVMPQRFAIRVLGAFSLMALALVVVGVHGLVSARMASRQHEVAIRVSLGANLTHLAMLVIRQGIVPVALGAGLGVGAGLLGSQGLRRFLFGIHPLDVQAFGAAVLLVLAAAGLAAGLCVWWAAKQDAAAVLKQQ